VIECFEEKSDRADLDWRLFKYRHLDGPWRLVWCWGYQLVRRSPAFAHICPNPDCRLLFLRKPGMRNKCPSCHGVVPKPRAALVASRRRLATVCLSLLLMAGLFWLLAWPDSGQVADTTTDARATVSREDVERGDHLHAWPEALYLRLGQSQQLVLRAPRDGSIELKSTSPEVVTVAPDGTVTAVGLGDAEVIVRQGDKEISVPVEVGGTEIAKLHIETDTESTHDAYPMDFAVYGPVLDDRFRFDRGRFVRSPYGPVWLPPDVAGPGRVPVPDNDGGVVKVSRPPRLDVLPSIDKTLPSDVDPTRPNAAIAGVPVKLHGWRPMQRSSTELQGEFEVAVNQLAEYRLTTKAGRPLTDWKTLIAGRVENLTTHAAFAATTDGAYELVVERRTELGEDVQTFSIYFTLQPAEISVSATR